MDKRLEQNPNDDAAMGTYDMSSGEPIKVNLSSGFQVSFQTTKGEGYDDATPMEDSVYDDTVNALTKETKSKPYIGYYGGIPEVSFTCKTLKQALEIGNRYAQHTVCNNKRAAKGIFDAKTFKKCPHYSYEKNPLYKYVNPKKRK